LRNQGQALDGLVLLGDKATYTPFRPVVKEVVERYLARVTSHIPDKGQVMVLYYGLYANAHGGKARKAGRTGFPVRIVEDPLPVPSKGWAEMIRKVYEVDPMVCPRCGGRMRVAAFLTECAVVDRIIRHLELTFVAEKPSPSRIFAQVALTEVEGFGASATEFREGRGGSSSFGRPFGRPGRSSTLRAPDQLHFAFLTPPRGRDILPFAMRRGDFKPKAGRFWRGSEKEIPIPCAPVLSPKSKTVGLSLKLGF
jgi:hypothetical protein